MNKFHLHMFAKSLLVIGAINYLCIVVLKTNVISLIPSVATQNFLYMIIGICGLYFLFNQNFYLPFLGECAFPHVVKTSQINTKDVRKIKVMNIPPNTKVVYWASQQNLVTLPDPMVAYGDYKNSGTTISNHEGKADFFIQPPSKYSVKFLGRYKNIPVHVHYRYELPKYKGMFSKVFTKYIN